VKTLQISHGDLVVSGGSYAMLTGPARIAQDLRLALGEPLANDRFHPGYGSQLESYVGLPGSPHQLFEIEQEVGRVVGLYSAVQRDRISRDTAAGVRSRYRTADVLASLTAVDVVQTGDAVSVRLSLRTADGQSEVTTATTGG
jgi:phage baseplate assembly protein W